VAVFFILDFNKEIGYGHLSRCSNIASHLLNLGVKSYLITFTKNFDIKNQFLKRKLEIFKNNILYLPSIQLRNETNLNLILEEINQLLNKNILIIDHYFLEKKFISRLNSYKYIIQIKDDYKDPDIINLNKNNNLVFYLLPTEIIPRNLQKSKNIFCGLDLFPTFAPNIDFHKPNCYKRFNINILLVPGAAGRKFSFDIVSKIKKLIKTDKIKIFCPNTYYFDSKYVTFFDGSKGIESYIYFSDLVFCAGGNTMIESINLKKRTLVFCTNQNQNSLIEFLENKRMIFYIRNIDQINCDFVYKNFKKDEITKKTDLDINLKYSKISELIKVLETKI